MYKAIYVFKVAGSTPARTISVGCKLGVIFFCPVFGHMYHNFEAQALVFLSPLIGYVKYPPNPCHYMDDSVLFRSKRLVEGGPGASFGVGAKGSQRRTKGDPKGDPKGDARENPGRTD